MARPYKRHLRSIDARTMSEKREMEGGLTHTLTTHTTHTSLSSALAKIKQRERERERGEKRVNTISLSLSHTHTTMFKMCVSESEKFFSQRVDTITIYLCQFLSVSLLVYLLRMFILILYEIFFFTLALFVVHTHTHTHTHAHALSHTRKKKFSVIVATSTLHTHSYDKRPKAHKMLHRNSAGESAAAILFCAQLCECACKCVRVCRSRDEHFFSPRATLTL